MNKRILHINNLQYNTNPMLLHCQKPVSKNCKNYWNIWIKDFFDNSKKQFGCPDNLTIITINTNKKRIGLFEKCCQHIGVPLFVLGREYHKYNKFLKIPVIIDFLQNKKHGEYILFADSYDVIINSDPHDILNVFLKEFSCGIMYGTCFANWCNVGLSYSVSKYNKPYISANSGLFIGRSDFVLEFFHYINKIRNKRKNFVKNPKLRDDNERWARVALNELYPRAFLDFECKIFQNLARWECGKEISYSFGFNQRFKRE